MRATGLVLLLSLGFGILVGSGEQDAQPISYNHQKHVAELGMTCLDCHPSAETQARASIPNIAICGDCHSDPQAENPQERRVANHVADNILIPWKQINLVPDYAYFSHRRHVRLGQIDCAACHGDVGAMAVPFARPFVPITMDWCMDCHERRAVTNDCASCHR